MSIERSVTVHYGRDGMVNIILDAALKQAPDPDNLTISDLAPFDELHIGGRKGTEHFIKKLDLHVDMHVLDIGSGIGGPARYVCETTGACVTGIDLTPEFCDTAETLSEHVGLSDRVSFEIANANDMPFRDSHFHAAYTIHVGMNIEDKANVYREIYRVLKPNSVFGIYDIMRGPSTGELAFPVHWAKTRDFSFLETPEVTQDLLVQAGFEVESVENRHDFALASFVKLKKLMAEGKMIQASYIHDSNYAESLQNMMFNVEKSLCSPWEIICRKA